MRVKAHKNLRKGNFSVTDPKTDLVIDSADHVYLKDVEFRVRPAGRTRARAEGQRNVHAFAVGERIASIPASAKAGKWHKFRYNPFKFDTFVMTDTEKPIYSAAYVILDETGTWVQLYPGDAKLAVRNNPPRRKRKAVRREWMLWNG